MFLHGRLLHLTRLRGNFHAAGLTGQEWSFGAVYVPLDKLTNKGFVKKTLSEPTTLRGGRSKCLYELTKTGKEALGEIRRVQDALWKDIPKVALD